LRGAGVEPLRFYSGVGLVAQTRFLSEVQGFCLKIFSLLEGGKVGEVAVWPWYPGDQLWDNRDLFGSSQGLTVNEVRTVSDTKRAFYASHTRPINSIYRRIVEELMVEMHLLSVNADFRYDPIYALGVVTVFDRFMQGYRPEGDKASIFNSLCQAVGGSPERYRQHAEQMQAEAASFSVDSFQETLKHLDSAQGELSGQLRGIVENPKFKYSRLFGVGLFTLLEQMNPAIATDTQQRNAILEAVTESLKIPNEKLQRDLEVYRSNLDKLIQAQAVMEDILKADRRKKEERAKQKDAVSTSATPSES